MTELYKIIGIGIVTLIAYLIIKPSKPELATFISIAGCVLIFIFCIDSLKVVIQTMTDFVDKTGINTDLLSCLLKIIGIGYITEFASNLCASSGNNSLGDAIGLAGKVTILVMSIPILTSLINIIIEILP